MQVKMHNVMVSCMVGFLFVAVAFSADSTYLADSTTRVPDLDRIVVRAQRNKLLAADIIDSTKLSKPQDSRTIDGFLTDIPGIDVKRSSPAGGKGGAVTLRGFDESRFIILLDGRPLNGSGVMGGEYVDWSSLSIDNIKEIEVIRGPKSAEFGNAFGGVINIISKGSKNLPEKTVVNCSYGVFSPEHTEDIHENRKTALSFSHRAKIGDLASLDVYASHGSGKPFLRNNYYNANSIGGNLALYLPAGIEMNTGLRQYIQYRGFALVNLPDDPYYNSDYPICEDYPGIGPGGPGLSWLGGDFYFGDRSYWKNIRTQADLALAKRFGKVSLSGRLFLNNQNRTEYFYAITDTNNLVLERFAKPEDYTWGWNIKAEQPLGESHVMKYGIEGIQLAYGNADIRQVDTSYFRFAPADGSDERIKASEQYSLYLQSELLFLDRLAVTPGVRYDYYIGTERNDTDMDETPLHGVSPNGGITLQTWKGGSVSLHSAYRYRFPTCPELYWYYEGHYFDGRKDLSPERALQFEGDLTHHLQAGKTFSIDFDVRGYRYNVTDYIRTIFGGRPPAGGTLVAKASRLIYNIDHVTLTGIEAEVKSKITDGLSARVNYTWQMTRKVGDDYDKSMDYSDGLPELPEHKANAAVEYNWKNSAFSALSMRFVGSRAEITESFTSTGAAYREINGFVTFRLSGMYPVYTSDAFSVKLKVGIDNLFNVEYEEMPGVPMPGLTGTAAVEVNF